MNAPVEAARLAPPRTLADLPAPRGWPWLGNLPQLDPTRAHRVLERWARELGTPYRLRLAARDVLVVADAESIHQVLRARPDAFRRGRPVQSVFAEMGIAGVFSAEGADWERQRRLVMRAFDPGHLRTYFPSLVTVTERLRRRWLEAARTGRPLDVQAEAMRYTVDVTAGLAFGADIDTIDRDDDVIQEHLGHVFPMLSRRMTAPFAYWRHVRLPADRALDRHLEAIQAAIREFVAQARARLAADPARREHPANLIEALLAARDQPDSGFSDADVSGNVFTALLAGEDTTANTFAWLCDFACDRPDVQRRLQEESDALLAGEDVLRDFARAPDLRYADAATREAMRLKPVAPVLFFEALEPVTVAGIELPRGTPVTTLMRLPGLDAALFPDPLAFRPERWLDPSGGPGPSETSAARKALMPFGAGPRFCPGRYLALLEIKMIASMLFRGFTLQRVEGTRAREHYSLSMAPRGLWVRLVPRR